MIFLFASDMLVPCRVTKGAVNKNPSWYCSWFRILNVHNVHHLLDVVNDKATYQRCPRHPHLNTNPDVHPEFGSNRMGHTTHTLTHQWINAHFWGYFSKSLPMRPDDSIQPPLASFMTPNIWLNTPFNLRKIAVFKDYRAICRPSVLFCWLDCRPSWDISSGVVQQKHQWHSIKSCLVNDRIPSKMEMDIDIISI